MTSDNSHVSEMSTPKRVIELTRVKHLSANQSVLTDYT